MDCTAWIILHGLYCMDYTAENYSAGNYTAGFPSFWEGGVPKGRGGR